MSQPASAALPDNIDSLVADIIREVGVAHATRNILRTHLEAKLKIDLRERRQEFSDVIERVLRRPEFAQELEAAGMKQQQQQQAGSRGAKRTHAEANDGSRGSNKRSRSESDGGDGAPERRGARERKPDDYPKAALSAYILFSNDMRQNIQKKNPDAKITEVSKMIATEWANASDKTKEQYRKRADDDRKRFERDMAAYTAKGGEVIKRGRKKGERRAAKDPNAPKRALSAYMFFAQDFRKRNSHLDIKEQMRQAGAAWNSMTPAAKKPFEDKAAKDKERYTREMGRRSK